MNMSWSEAKKAFEQKFTNLTVKHAYDLDRDRFLLHAIGRNGNSDPFYVVYKNSGRVVNFIPSANLALFGTAVRERMLYG